MAGAITSEQLKSQIEATELQIRKLRARRTQLDSELKLLRKLLEQADSDPELNKERKRTASDAILELLSRIESASTKELLVELPGTFQTRTDPTSAIYAAIDTLKRKKQIEPLPSDLRRYRRVEADSDSEMQRAAS